MSKLEDDPNLTPYYEPLFGCCSRIFANIFAQSYCLSLGNLSKIIFIIKTYSKEFTDFPSANVKLK